MHPVLHWLPIVWALRVATLVVLVDGLALFALLTARFFRWRHVKQLVLADLPRVQSVAGGIGGTRAAVELVSGEAEQIAVLSERLAALQRRVDVLVESMREGDAHEPGT